MDKSCFKQRNIIQQRWKEYLDEVHRTKLKCIKPTVPRAGRGLRKSPLGHRLESLHRVNSENTDRFISHKPPRNQSYHQQLLKQRRHPSERAQPLRQSYAKRRVPPQMLYENYYTQPQTQFILKKGKFLGDSYWVFEIRRDAERVYVKGYDAYSPEKCSFQLTHDEFAELTQSQANYYILFDLIDMKDHTVALLSVVYIEMNNRSELIKSIYATKKEFSVLERQVRKRKPEGPKTIQFVLNLNMPITIVKKEWRKLQFLQTRPEPAKVTSSFEALPLSYGHSPGTMQQTLNAKTQLKKLSISHSVQATPLTRRSSARKHTPYRLIRIVKE